MAIYSQNNFTTERTLHKNGPYILILVVSNLDILSEIPESPPAVLSEQQPEGVIPRHSPPHTDHVAFYAALITSSQDPEVAILPPVLAPGVSTRLSYRNKS